MLSRHRRVWRITRRAGAWPCWLLVEDVLADDLAMENGGQLLVLYRAETVVDEPRRVVAARLDVRDVVEVVEVVETPPVKRPEPICGPRASG